MRASVERSSVNAQTLSAVTAIPGCAVPAKPVICAVDFHVFASSRAIAPAEQSGAHRLSNPTTAPPHGFDTMVTGSAALLVRESIFTHPPCVAGTIRASDAAIQTGAIGNSASAFSEANGIRTPGVLMPSFGVAGAALAPWTGFAAPVDLAGV